MRLRIRWRDGAYRVSVPNWEGGEVVTADEHDEAVRLLAALVGWADDGSAHSADAQVAADLKAAYALVESHALG